MSSLSPLCAVAMYHIETNLQSLRYQSMLAEILQTVVNKTKNNSCKTRPPTYFFSSFSALCYLSPSFSVLFFFFHSLSSLLIVQNAHARTHILTHETGGLRFSIEKRVQKYEQNDLLVATAASTLQWALIEHTHTRTYTCLNAPNILQARLFYRNRTTPICMTKYAQVETNNYLSYSCTNLVNYANIYDRDKQHYKLNSTFGSVVVVGGAFYKRFNVLF